MATPTVYNPKITIISTNDSNPQRYQFKVTHINGKRVSTARDIYVGYEYNQIPLFSYSKDNKKYKLYQNYMPNSKQIEINDNGYRYVINRSAYKLYSNGQLKWNGESSKPLPNKLELSKGKTFYTANGHRVYIVEKIYASSKLVSQDTFIALLTKDGSKDETARYSVDGKILSHGKDPLYNIVSDRNIITIFSYNWIDDGRPCCYSTYKENDKPQRLQYLIGKDSKFKYKLTEVQMERD
jgi:hypothetical protein